MLRRAWGRSGCASIEGCRVGSAPPRPDVPRLRFHMGQRIGGETAKAAVNWHIGVIYVSGLIRAPKAAGPVLGRDALDGYKDCNEAA